MKIGKSILDNKSSGLISPKKQANKSLERLSEQRPKKKTQDVEETEVRFKVPEEGQQTQAQIAKQQSELVAEKRAYNEENTSQDTEAEG